MIFGNKKTSTIVKLVFPEGWKFNFTIEYIPRVGETINIPIHSKFAEQVGRCGEFEVGDIVYNYANQNDGKSSYSHNTIFIHLELVS